MNQTKWGKITAYNGIYLVLLGVTSGVGDIPWTTTHCRTVQEAIGVVTGFLDEAPNDIGISATEKVGTTDAL